MVPQITCSDEDNLMKNTDFESGNHEGWTVTDKTYFPIEEMTGFDGGNKAVHISPAGGRWPYMCQNVFVKPNTEYVATIVYKCALIEGNVQAKSHWKILSQQGSSLINVLDKELHFGLSDEDWLIDTVTVNSGAQDNLYFWLTAGDSNAYIDSVYLFEKK
jgi:hypothetical protein